MVVWRSLLLVIAASLFSFSAPSAAETKNLVENPGFEDIDEDGKSLVAWGLPQPGGVRFSWDDEVYHSGRRAGRVDGLQPERQSRYVQAWRQNIHPLPGGLLWLSVWVKADDLVDGQVRVLHKDREGEVLHNQTIATFRGTHDWKELGDALDSVPDCESLELVLGIVKSTGSAWFDDVELIPLSDEPNLHGQFDVVPLSPQPAGSKARIEFKVTVGRSGLAPGGRVVLRWDNWRTAREFRLNNIDASSTRADSSFKISVPPVKKTWPPDPKPTVCVVELAEGDPMRKGDEIVITADATYSRHSNVAAPISVQLAPSPSSTLRPLHGSFNFQSKSGPVAEIRVIAEARPVVGSAGRVTVAMTDEYGNPVEDFRGTVNLDCDNIVHGIQPYTFTDDDAGSHDFALEFPEGVVSRVRASWNDLQGLSNPILPRRPSESGVYFGDIHSHCEISPDGAGDPELAYDYARRFHGLDFAALSDHSPRGAAWERSVDITNRFNQAGRFVTFLAFEWSDPVRGHRNAYYRGDAGPAHPVGVADNMASWWSFFDERGLRVLTIPHHPNTQAAQIREDGNPAWGPMDWSVINHKYQRVVEICQIRGSFETPGGPIPELRIVREDVGSSVQTALAMGHHLGFIGSTDTHGGRPGTGPARCAIVAHEFSREGLWDALYARSCYATTGKHILVFFELNGQPMGSEIDLSDAGRTRTVSWRVIGTAPLKQVDLLRNNTIHETWRGEGSNDLSEVYTTESSSDEREWWYLRAIEEDTEMAWSSPIWVD